MARKAVEVRSCDRCGSESAYTWVITGPEGLPREIELCEPHSAPVANLYALARPVAARPAARAKTGRATARPPAPEKPAVDEPAPAVREPKPAVREPQPVFREPEPIWR